MMDVITKVPGDEITVGDRVSLDAGASGIPHVVVSFRPIDPDWDDPNVRTAVLENGYELIIHPGAYVWAYRKPYNLGW